jgi:hypothetical protein
MNAVWSPLRTVAHFAQQDWSVELDPARPTSFLTLSSPTGIRWEALAINPLPNHSLHAEEIYVRQQDLIARFSQVGKDQYGFQVDWRLLDTISDFEVGIEVWISLQTNLLDSAPKIQARSRGVGAWKSWTHQQLVSQVGPSDDASQGWSSQNASAIAAISSSTQDCSCLCLIEPRDLQQVSWTSQPSNNEQQAELFGQFLEKGVIRRARMQLLASKKQIGLLEIQRAYQQLINRELPLTA